MKIITAGAGEVGFHVAQKLTEENQEVFLIDKDTEKVRRIDLHLVGGCLYPECWAETRDGGTRAGSYRSAGASDTYINELEA